MTDKNASTITLSTNQLNSSSRAKGNKMKTKNEFKEGNTVKIGFMTLTVLFQSKDKDYYRARAWILESAKGIRYQFTPYYGLERL